jgi:hypothetical protein
MLKTIIICAVEAEAVHKTGHARQNTDESINNHIGKWLRNSIDRKGGRIAKKRAHPKRNGNSTSDKEETGAGGSNEDAEQNSEVLNPN